MQKILVPLQAEDEELIPTYSTEDASGADARASVKEPVVIEPGCTAMIPTGLKVAIPSRYKHTGHLIHYPIIHTVPLPIDIHNWPEVTHVLFTSPNAVKHWTLPLHSKTLISIGPSTASLLPPSLIAPFATQEGVIALLQTLTIPYLLWPRSSQSRPLLTSYLTENNIRFQAVDLYKTVSQYMGPLPEYDEIVFTSPSTVRAFTQIFGPIPSGKKITAIGPITADYLRGLG